MDEGVTLRLIWRMVLPLLFMSLFALTPIVVPLVVVSPVALPLLVNWCGARWAVKTGSAIADESEQGTYDLLALFPFGGLGASWAICSGCLHGGSTFDHLQTFVRILLRTVIFILCVALLVAVLIAANGYSSRPERGDASPFITLIYAAALAAAFYIDYVQSVVGSSLVGMMVATYVHNHTDARLWGIVGYLALKILIYLIAWIIGFVLLPGVHTRLGIHGWQADVTLATFRVALLYLAHEGFIVIVWRTLTRRLNAGLTDLDGVWRRT